MMIEFLADVAQKAQSFQSEQQSIVCVLETSGASSFALSFFDLLNAVSYSDQKEQSFIDRLKEHVRFGSEHDDHSHECILFLASRRNKSAGTSDGSVFCDERWGNLLKMSTLGLCSQHRIVSHVNSLSRGFTMKSRLKSSPFFSPHYCKQFPRSQSACDFVGWITMELLLFVCRHPFVSLSGNASSPLSAETFRTAADIFTVMQTIWGDTMGSLTLCDSTVTARSAFLPHNSCRFDDEGRSVFDIADLRNALLSWLDVNSDFSLVLENPVALGTVIGAEAILLLATRMKSGFAVLDHDFLEYCFRDSCQESMIDFVQVVSSAQSTTNLLTDYVLSSQHIHDELFPEGMTFGKPIARSLTGSAQFCIPPKESMQKTLIELHKTTAPWSAVGTLLLLCDWGDPDTEDVLSSLLHVSMSPSSIALIVVGGSISQKNRDYINSHNANVSSTPYFPIVVFADVGNAVLSSINKSICGENENLLNASGRVSFFNGVTYPKVFSGRVAGFLSLRNLKDPSSRDYDCMLFVPIDAIVSTVPRKSVVVFAPGRCELSRSIASKSIVSGVTKAIRFFFALFFDEKKSVNHPFQYTIRFSGTGCCPSGAGLGTYFHAAHNSISAQRNAYLRSLSGTLVGSDAALNTTLFVVACEILLSVVERIILSSLQGRRIPHMHCNSSAAEEVNHRRMRRTCNSVTAASHRPTNTLMDLVVAPPLHHGREVADNCLEYDEFEDFPDDILAADCRLSDIELIIHGALRGEQVFSTEFTDEGKAFLCSLSHCVAASSGTSSESMMAAALIAAGDLLTIICTRSV